MYAVLNYRAGLREWGCMIGIADIVDNPVPAHTNPTAADLPVVERACRTSVRIIMALFHRFRDLIALRETLSTTADGADPTILTMGDAGLGEHIVINQLVKLSGVKKGTMKRAAWSQEPPTSITVGDLLAPCINFQTTPFQEVDAAIRAGTIADGTLHTTLAENQVELAGVAYRFGLGGLHSIDKPAYYQSSFNAGLVDLDVTSC